MNYSLKKILITGSNGLLGQKLVQYCLQNNIDFLATSFGKNRISFCPKEKYRQLDITNSQEVEEIISEYQPTDILNAAAMTDVDACEVEVERCYQINKIGVENLVKASANKDIHLVQISTDFIFEGIKMSYNEEDEANPLSIYGKSKWEGELAVLHSNLEKTTILRTSLLYGVGENLQKGNIFKWAMDKLKNKEEINIVNDQFRTPTYVMDLMKACFEVIAKKKYGVYHIAGNSLHSMYEFILLVADYVGADKRLVKPISSDTLNQKANRPKSSGLNISKAKKEWDYQPSDFMQTLKLIEE